MNNGILYSLLAVLVIVSGCTSNFDATEFIKTNQAIKTLLTDYPNARVVATYVTNASISEECSNPQLQAKNYWKVNIFDEESNLTINTWIEADTKNVVCIVKTGGKGIANKTEDRETINIIQNQTYNQSRNQSYVLHCPDRYNCTDDNYCSDGVCKPLNCEAGYHAENHTCKLTVYVPRLNCRELGGHLCSDITISIGPLTSSTSPRCALSWLNSTDSYCCPIECGSCPTDCDDGNSCTNDFCRIENNTFQCKHTQISNCLIPLPVNNSLLTNISLLTSYAINNSICEPFGELGCIHAAPLKCENICGTSGCGETFCISNSPILSSDCPVTCDDGDNYTLDMYNFTTQKCEHINCPKTCEGYGHYSNYSSTPSKYNCKSIPLSVGCLCKPISSGLSKGCYHCSFTPGLIELFP